jgi:hypothetical protein
VKRDSQCDTEILIAELEAIAHWDRSLIFRDSISALDHLSYQVRQERKQELEAELRKRNPSKLPLRTGGNIVSVTEKKRSGR